MKNKEIIYKNSNVKVKVLNDTATYGYVKNSVEFITKVKLYEIGLFNVKLLKEMIKKLKDDDAIGIYITEDKQIAPCHCKGYLLCPMIPSKDNDKYEFRNYEKEEQECVVKEL